MSRRYIIYRKGDKCYCINLFQFHSWFMDCGCGFFALIFNWRKFSRGLSLWSHFKLAFIHMWCGIRFIYHHFRFKVSCLIAVTPAIDRATILGQNSFQLKINCHEQWLSYLSVRSPASYHLRKLVNLFYGIKFMFHSFNSYFELAVLFIFHPLALISLVQLRL